MKKIFNKVINEPKMSTKSVKKGEETAKGNIEVSAPQSSADLEKLVLENIERFDTNINDGLTNAQVELRGTQGLLNTKPKALSKSYSEIFRTNFMTLFNLLNIILFVFVLIFGQVKNALFICIIVANVIIGTIQEVRAKKTVEKLSLLSAPKATVVRNGVEVEIEIEALALDDILMLKTGNEVISDCILLDGECEVNESLLTGEQDAVVKHKGDVLFSGSFIVSGRCKAKIDKVGNQNYASKIVANAQRYKAPNSELMKSIQWIIRIISFIIVPVGILVFWRQLENLPLNEAVVKTVASLIGMIPEGLVLLTSLALAVGVVKLSKHNTLVQELYCIETLARVDVLCLDKTGTITEGLMQVEEVVPIIENKISNIVTGTIKGAMLTKIEQKRLFVSDVVTNLVKALSDKNPTFLALDDYFKSQTSLDVVSTIAFSSKRKWCAVQFKENGYYLGAPEFLLKENYKDYKDDVSYFAEKGFRVLLLCQAKKVSENYNLNTIKPIAYIVLSDKIRANAKQTLNYFYQQGVNLKVISGDNPITVSKVAERAGLLNADKYVDATTLDSYEKLFDACDKYTIFGRVTPNQKKILVSCLKKKGHTVGMMGDGVNDVMALKEADCSIAIASGSDAARHTSQLVLLDSDFGSLPQVVCEGRRVINNIARSSSLFLVKTTYSLLLSLLVIFFSMEYPFEPIQLTLVSTVLVGGPSFFMAIEPNDARVRGRFFHNVAVKAFPAGICVAVMIVFTSLICKMLNTPPEFFSTTSIFITSIVAFFVLFDTCRPLNLFRFLLTGIALIVYLFCVFFLHEFFIIKKLSVQMYLVVAGLGACSYPLIVALKLLIKHLLNSIERHSERRKRLKKMKLANMIKSDEEVYETV